MTRTAGKKSYVRLTILGIISLLSYYLLLANQSLVTDYFIKGGAYALLPIGTALYFSFVHGAFCSGLLTIARISAKGSSH
ncbi:MAG: hypothetical protein IBX61_04400 [Thermoleophilia bacterium]|nr:hypothetical protein [Thermoleophilia bacterium]